MSEAKAQLTHQFQALANEILEEKSKRWARLQNKRYAHRRRFAALNSSSSNGLAAPHKELLPPEHVRKILADHGDMSGCGFYAEDQTQVGACLDHFPLGGKWLGSRHCTYFFKKRV